ncbi:M23 family metallopeptidase [Oscillospiraceae bacterium 50-16]
MYSQSTAVRSRGGAARRGSRSRGGGQERVRAAQLAVCLVLFLTAYIGKGIFPGRLMQVREEVLFLISEDFDFQGALAGLGESLAGSGTVLEDLGAFCVQVFGPQEISQPDSPELLPPQPDSVLDKELDFLSGNPDAQTRTEHYASTGELGLDTAPVPEAGQTETQGTAAETSDAAAEEQPQAVPAAGTVVLYSDYAGEPLPNNYTMDQISLGELETIVPVFGHLNSGYGYRDHPIDGRYQFHGGVDIGGQYGDPVAAFAAGTVEYIGEDDSYGLYLQIDHGNGVKSFYAHCSKLEVSKGQQVALGETVARVGSSGSATGPHLHLELKYGKMHLNPVYYLTFQEGE